ncbi:MAG: energy transducer TonB, partial [Deltaproteobacteria bacterium]|nr:energy transducer TonB [Deltaproteobacteria bacterium]
TEFDSDSGPKFLHREMPQYPMIARRLGKEGRVILRLTIDEKGNLINIKVIENADYGFTEAAVEAVKKSTFLPAMIDGRPVTTRAVLPIKFTLRRD